MRFTLLTLSAVLLGCAFSAQAKMYKWVDENGQMHFGDRIPPEYVVKEHDELNEHGIKTKHREAAKTPEQKAEERRLEREQKKKALADKKKQQVAVQTKVMESHKKRSVDISEQFNGYIERFKVLKAEQKAKRERLAKERGY